MNKAEILKSLSNEEKAALLLGTDFMYTNAIPNLKIPALKFADGTYGVRTQDKVYDNGVGQSLPATSFPTAATVACSWDCSILYKMGKAMAVEAKAYGVDLLLSVGMNIKRNAKCGRNFEYFSEDPFLVGELAIALAKGIERNGVGACIKHFAANNQENNRFFGNSVVDKRAVFEIYLKAFKQVVKEVNPSAVMCAYNKLNGIFCSENEWLLTDILRKEWGYNGVVISDWGAVNDRVKGVNAGLDIEMPGDTPHSFKAIVEMLEKEALEKETSFLKSVDKAVLNILGLIEKCDKNREKTAEPLMKIDEGLIKKHHELCGEIAINSAVLLKNDGVLPLNKDEKIFVVGDFFENMRYQGFGSSMVNATKVTSPKDAFLKSHISFEFEKGYIANDKKPNKSLITKTLNAARNFEKVLVFAGLDDFSECEGVDREHLNLPKNQTELILALANMGKKITLVLFSGSVIELPVLDKINAIVYMGLCGQNGGEACQKLLFGERNFSGKLAETWATSDTVLFNNDYSKNVNELYRESIYVGYRYYDKVNASVVFPFGFGLSYSKFEYFDLQLVDNGCEIIATMQVFNQSEIDGAEIVQLYARHNKSKVFRADKELVGFFKVFLKSGQIHQVEIAFKKQELMFFNVVENAFILSSGEYEILVGASSQDIRLKKTIIINSERDFLLPYDTSVNVAYDNPCESNLSLPVFEKLLGAELPTEIKVKPLTLSSRIVDFKRTFFGKIIYFSIKIVLRRTIAEAKKTMTEKEIKEAKKSLFFLKKSLDNMSVRGLCMTAGKRLPLSKAEALVAFGNGKVITSIKKLREKPIELNLPKDKDETKEDKDNTHLESPNKNKTNEDNDNLCLEVKSKKKNKTLKQFILFNLMSFLVTLFQLAFMPLMKWIFLSTSWTEVNFQVFKLVGGQRPYYIFDFPKGSLASGGGGGLAYFLAVQITVGLAQVVSFILQRKFTFGAKHNVWIGIWWFFCAFVVLTFGMAALSSLYKEPLYNAMINKFGDSGDIFADILSMLINSIIAMAVYFPVMKYAF